MSDNSRKTILLVEDDAITSMAESAVLNRYGFNIITAMTGEASVQMAKERAEIALVLMDIDLGAGIDGTEAAREILLVRDIPVVFLSSHTEREIVDKTEKITSYGYVVKNSGDTVLAASINMAFRLHEAHLKLRESEGRYRRIVETSREGIWSMDADHTTTYVNREMARLLGYTEEEILGCGAETFMYEEDFAEHKEKMALLQKGENQLYERRFRRRDDTPLWTLVSATAITGGDGAFNGSFAMFTDITEWKTAEDEVKRREKLLERILNILPVGLWFADKEGRLIGSNEVGEKIWGAQHLVGMEEYGVFKARRLPGREELAPEDWALSRTIREGVTITDELLEIDAFDGVKRCVLNYTAPILDDYGAIRGAVVVNQDVTDRVRAEEALRISEQKYREIFNSTNEAIFIDEAATGKMIDVNESMLKMYGYDSREEVLAGNIGDLSSGEESFGQKEAEEYITRAINEGPQVFEWIAKKKNGEKFWAEVSLKSSDIGGEGRILAVVRDMSERKQTENMLKLKTEALAAALDDKDALMRELQHRVKNSLSMIAGLIEIEAMNVVSPETELILEKLALRIYSISNLYSLLYQRGNVQKVRLDDYFSRIISSLKATFVIGNRDILLNSDLENVEVDAGNAAPFGLLLNELMTNALKYAFHSGADGSVSVRLRKNEGSINLTVSDNGAGLPHDFDMEKSSGMGMMLIKMLTEQLGGTVSYENNGGTVFRINVPEF